MWENNRDVDNQVQTLLSSHFRPLELFLGVRKRLQAKGAHAEAPEQSPAEGRGGWPGVLDGQPHGGPQGPQDGPGPGPHLHRPRVTSQTPSETKSDQIILITRNSALKTKSSKILTTVILH